MKKLLLSLMLAAACLSAQAQESAAYAKNTFFWSFNVGGTYYLHDGSGEMTLPSGGLYLGRWLMRPFAFRVAADMVMAPSVKAPDAGNATFLFGSAEFMWDINSTFFHVYNKTFLYPIPVYPLLGLGLVYRVPGASYGEDRDFQAMMGLHFPIRIGSRLDLFLEYKCFFLPNSFDNSYGVNNMHMATLGLTHRWSDTPFYRKGGYETRAIAEDWFTGFGVGGSFSSFDFADFGTEGSKLINWTGDMMFGRNFSNIWTIRLELSGFFGREQYQHINDTVAVTGRWYTFNSLHSDFMINLTHLLNFRRGVKWNFLPYLGAGPVWRYDKHPVFTVSGNAGLMVRRYIDNMGDFYIDMKYIMVPPRLAGGTTGNVLGVGFPTVTFGYICNFGHSTTRYRMPLNQCAE